MFITRNRRTLRRSGAAALAASAALVLGGCGDTAGPETGTDVKDIQEEGGAVGDDGGAGGGADGDDGGVFEDPQSFAGQEVTVSAEVSEIVGPNAFTIGADNAEPLLVVHDGSSAPTVDTPIQVTGTVMKSFALPDEEEFFDADFDDPLFVDYDGEPYVRAGAIDTTPPFEGE